MCGYQIAKRLGSLDGVLSGKRRLYPVLRNLETAACWKASSNRRCPVRRAATTHHHRRPRRIWATGRRLAATRFRRYRLEGEPRMTAYRPPFPTTWSSCARWPAPIRRWCGTRCLRRRGPAFGTRRGTRTNPESGCDRVGRPAARRAGEVATSTDTGGEGCRPRCARQRQRHGARARAAFFGVAADGRTGALFCMLLALATGIFYFTWVVTGMSMSGWRC